MTRMSSHFLLAALCATLCAGLPDNAHASHYFLDDIDFIAAPISAELKAHGIQTTEDLLMRVLSVKDRETLDAAINSLSIQDIEQLARILELMQIDGIGPKAARLLRAAGVASIKDLSARDPSALLDLVIAANAKARHTEVNPDLIILDDWIQRAKEATVHVH